MNDSVVEQLSGCMVALWLAPSRALMSIHLFTPGLEGSHHTLHNLQHPPCSQAQSPHNMTHKTTTSQFITAHADLAWPMFESHDRAVRRAAASLRL